MGHEVHVESSRPLIPVLDPTSGAQYHHHPQQLDSSSAHKLPQATGPGLPSILQAQMPIAHQAACIFLSLCRFHRNIKPQLITLIILSPSIESGLFVAYLCES
ncbi:hypothetical protein ACFX2G_016178 [Malus domestica]